MIGNGEVGLAFWILSVVILGSAFMVVSLKNIFHCAIFLILALSGVAGIFILLNAEFLAAAQVLLYVGAVAILMVFAIMLTSDLASRKIIQTNQNALVAFLACVVFLASLVWLIRASLGSGIWNFTEQMLPSDNVMTIGKLLMTKYMLPFEVVSVLLLAAMIGAIVLARRERS